MSSVKHPGSTPQPVTDEKPPSLVISDMLTPSELEELRRISNEHLDYLQKVYPDLKIIR